MAAANKVSKLIVGQGGFLSTPAVSNLIRCDISQAEIANPVRFEII